MSSRRNSLAKFPRTNQVETPSTERTLLGRVRASGEIVGMTFRMRREDWLRLHAVAKEKNTTFQGLFLLGMSEILKSQGLPPMEPPN